MTQVCAAKVPAITLVLLIAGCTPGGMSPPPGGSGGANVTTIDVNLTLHASTQTPEGVSTGYAPAVTLIAVGTSVRFTNSDSFAHTATLIPGAASFPAASPFSATALTQSGSTLSQPWSSGALPAGSSSQTILVNQPGTYLYGCFFHYSGTMRGIIVAQ